MGQLVSRDQARRQKMKFQLSGIFLFSLSHSVIIFPNRYTDKLDCGQSEKCVSHSQCPPAIKLLQEELVRPKICSYETDTVNICCRKEDIVSPRPLSIYCGSRTLRKNVNDLSSRERRELNSALGNMKALGVSDPTDWRSYGKIASYHGAPFMCDEEWIDVFPAGNGSFPCCDHSDRVTLLFQAWHRPYLKNFELALHSAGLDTSIGLPYWYWTDGGEVPSSGEVPVLLPEFAMTESNWISGPTPSGQMTERNQQLLFTSNLRTKVRTALCQSNYLDYDLQMEEPHNEVHALVVGGHMGSIAFAAYDPIFYLHHSNIDRFYAYWQELQALRGLSSATTQIRENATVQDREMPPFTSPEVNPFFSLTGLSPTQAFGLNYQENYCYRYERLVFDGLTPSQFHQSNQCGGRQLATVVTRDSNRFSRNDLLVIDRSRNDEIITTIYNAFITTDKPWEHRQSNRRRRSFDIDVTDHVKNHLDSNTIDFEVISFGSRRVGNSGRVKNVYKPFSEFVTAEGGKKIKVHADYF